ncbi:YdcH family protein [Geopseudomonas aromaticivorans]
MPHARHPLHREFPEHQEQLRALLASDSHFGQLAERYAALDKRIYAAEDGREPLDDFALQTLKNERVLLKDQIAARLRQAGNGG